MCLPYQSKTRSVQSIGKSPVRKLKFIAMKRQYQMIKIAKVLDCKNPDYKYIISEAFRDNKGQIHQGIGNPFPASQVSELDVKAGDTFNFVIEVEA